MIELGKNLDHWQTGHYHIGSSEKPLLITDMDGCLVNWLEPFKFFVIQKCPNATFNSNYPKEWDLNRWISNVDVNKAIDEFNRSDFLGLLKPFRESSRYMLPLTNLCEVVILTSAGRSNFQKRLEILYRLYGKIFNGLICIDIKESKKTILANFISRKKVYWVEDNYWNAMYGKEFGYTTFFMKHFHNHKQVTEQNGLIVVESWSEIHKKILKDVSNESINKR